MGLNSSNMYNNNNMYNNSNMYSSSRLISNNNNILPCNSSNNSNPLHRLPKHQLDREVPAVEVDRTPGKTLRTQPETRRSLVMKALCLDSTGKLEERKNWSLRTKLF